MVSNIILSLLRHADKKIVKTAAKSLVKMAPPVTEVIKSTDNVLINKVGKSDVLDLSAKTLKTKISRVLQSYNARKLEVSKKFGTSDKILNNWKDMFGVADKNGVYKNAVEYLAKSGKIDSYITSRLPQITDPKDIEFVRNILTKYLEKNLDIYSYSRIEKILRGFNPEITAKLNKGAVLYVPDESKSYGIISEIYKTINPEAKVVTGWKNLKEFAKTQKDLDVIMLDDCLVSGESATKAFESITGKSGCADVRNVDLYLLSAFEEGVAKLPKGINVKYNGELRHNLKFSDYFKNEVENRHKGLLMSLLGTGSPEYNAYSAMMFEYMAPNNNSKFAAQMIKELFSGPECAIKGVFQPVKADDKVVNSVMNVLTNLRHTG